VALAGKNYLMKVSTVAGGAGAYNTVQGGMSGSMNSVAGMIDITTFQQSFVVQIQGLKDASYSFAGNWEPGDTTGQVALRNSWLNDTEIWVQHLPDGVNGFKQQIRVSSFSIGAEVNDKIGVTFEAQGTGVISAVP
jgi:predicted secreted protein